MPATSWVVFFYVIVMSHAHYLFWKSSSANKYNWRKILIKFCIYFNWSDYKKCINTICLFVFIFFPGGFHYINQEKKQSFYTEKKLKTFFFLYKYLYNCFFKITIKKLLDIQANILPSLNYSGVWFKTNIFQPEILFN